MRKKILIFPIILLTSLSINKIVAQAPIEVVEEEVIVKMEPKDELKELYDEQLELMKEKKDRLQRRLKRIERKIKKVKDKKQDIKKMSDAKIQREISRAKAKIAFCIARKERRRKQFKKWREMREEE